MRGKGTAYGAGTIINAMATGKGAAFGLDLKTEAQVDLSPGSGDKVRLIGYRGEDHTLALLCAQRVIERFAPEKSFHIEITTRSQIPISKGLKSSSAAANAVMKATLDALGIKSYDVLEIIKLGAQCAIEAGVSITGAMDDACASWLGGIAFTNNRKRELIKHLPFPPGYKVLIHVPKQQIRKRDLPLEKIAALRDIVDIAFETALRGDIFNGMTLNGLCYSAALGLKQDIVAKALEHRAAAAGLSGSGPATIIIIEEKELEDFLKYFEGIDFLRAEIRNPEV